MSPFIGNPGDKSSAKVLGFDKTEASSELCGAKLEVFFGKDGRESKGNWTHRTGTHPEQPLPTGYKGIPFIMDSFL